MHDLSLNIWVITFLSPGSIRKSQKQTLEPFPDFMRPCKWLRYQNRISQEEGPESILFCNHYEWGTTPTFSECSRSWPYRRMLHTQTIICSAIASNMLVKFVCISIQTRENNNKYCSQFHYTKQYTLIIWGRQFEKGFDKFYILNICCVTQSSSWRMKNWASNILSCNEDKFQKHHCVRIATRPGILGPRFLRTSKLPGCVSDLHLRFSLFWSFNAL